jgi:hypothetical protein
MTSWAMSSWLSSCLGRAAELSRLASWLGRASNPPVPAIASPGLDSGAADHLGDAKCKNHDAHGGSEPPNLLVAHDSFPFLPQTPRTSNFRQRICQSLRFLRDASWILLGSSTFGTTA